jgi:hypothetical protein
VLLVDISRNMNHTTLGIVAVFVAAALVIGTFAATTSATPAFASKVKVGSTKNKCKERSDQSQHIAFGAGAIGNLAANAPIGVQLQACNAGSTGTGGSDGSDGSSGVWDFGLNNGHN